MSTPMRRAAASWTLAGGGVMIAAASVALAARGNRESISPALVVLVAGFVAVQVGLAWLALSESFGSRRVTIAVRGLVIVPAVVIVVAMLAFWAGVPWEFSAGPGFAALLATPLGWLAFTIAAIRSGLVSLRLGALALWAIIIALLFEVSSLRALAVVPLGVAWLAVGLETLPAGRRVDRRSVAMAAAALVVVAVVATGATKASARPTGTPGAGPTGTTTAVIIDTDSLPDDWMAITFLLTRQDVDVRAITVTGSAVLGCADGQRQVLRILALFDRTDVPVACGRTRLTAGGHPFPVEWRQGNLDLMATVSLPEPLTSPDARPAPEVIAAVLAASEAPTTIIALGPLTNLLDAFAVEAGVRDRVAEIVIMGGALDVGGNTDGGPAEWNFYVDPAAASFVLGSGRPITLVALDGTSDAPATAVAVEDIRAGASTPPHRFVADLLAAMSGTIAAGDYFFWDPLAAVVAVDGRIAGFTTERLDVIAADPEGGRLVRSPLGGSVRIAVSADPAAFLRTFVDSLATASP